MQSSSNFLSGKHILIGVTGSIALYKTLDLIRLFIKAGADVRVIMTESAKRFISPLLFEAISQNTVLHEESESWANDLNHIHIGKWADLFLIAPASANTINKFAHGHADTLLLQSALAYTKPVLIAPAANTHMLDNPATREGITKLKAFGYHIIDSQVKMLACQDIGKGAMAEPEVIFWEATRQLMTRDYWLNRPVIITGGGTRENIDDVRCISNFSSGKMAESLAFIAYSLGADVTLITTQCNETIYPQGMSIHSVNSSKELSNTLHLTLNAFKQSIKPPYLFMAAAISDYVPEQLHEGKLKKDSLGQTWNLTLIQNRDILKNIEHSQLKAIGFKAETDSEHALQNAEKMLQDKNLDGVCLNVIDKNHPFGGDNNQITLLTKDRQIHFEPSSKFEQALKILTTLCNP